MRLHMNRNISTFLKYLVSYILILSILMLCFFLILRKELTEAYVARQEDRVTAQAEAAAVHLTSEIRFLLQIDDLITHNSDIKLATYRGEGKYWRITHQELEQYASSSSLIASIVYYSHFSDHIFTTKEYLKVKDSVFTLTNGATKMVVFNPTPYLDAAAGQLIFLSSEDAEYLLWFPVNKSGAKYLYFYILDSKVIQSQLNTLLSNEVLAVALVDGEGRYVTGAGFENYEALLAGKAPAQGIINAEDGTFIYTSSPIQDGFALAAVVSGAVLKQQVNGAFVRSYLSLLGLSLVGIILVYVAMLFTYRPLQHLVKNLGHEPQRHQNYLEVISRNHRELMTQKAELEKALAEFRESLAQNAQSKADTPDYPHEELGGLTVCLREKRFSDARNLTEILLSQPDSSPDYFLSCIALDCLTVISNSMNRTRIEFEVYADTYMQAVHRCRKIRQTQDVHNLKGLILELLDFYERTWLAQTVQTAPLKHFVETRFCDPDFSITELAEAYHVSTSRMSSMFKAEMGVGFLDYVWKLRLEKAQRMLLETDLSVDEISQAIGYLAATSFSRKFKQDLGVTPSQYRSQFTDIVKTE